MRAIYEPKGAAREYSPLACNLWAGCLHGCLYCYCPQVLHVSPREFHAISQLRPGVLEALEREAPRYSGGNAPVFFSFTADPYQIGQTGMRSALRIMARHDVPVQLLTKGGHRAEIDFDLLAGMRGAQFGVTLVFSREADRMYWEPSASPLSERVQSLRRAHRLGIRTFISLEPIIDPRQALDVLRECAPFCDEFRLGKLNHHAAAKEVDWRKWAPRIVQAAQETGRAVLVKDSLRPYLQEPSR